jgi:hypothetical protein
MDRLKKNEIIGIILLLVVIVGAAVFSFRGTNLQGMMREGVRSLKSADADGVAMPAGKDAVNKADLSRIVVTSLSVNPNSYKDCAPDVKGLWYEKYACYMVDHRFVSLSNDGRFNGDKFVTRAEGAKIFTTAFIKNVNWYSGNQTVFVDVKPTDWFYKYVMTLVQKRVIDVGMSAVNLPQGQKQGQYFYPATYLSKDEAMGWAGRIVTSLMR